MLHNCKAQVTIKKVDNGFIIEWEHEKPKMSEFSRAVRGKDDWRDCTHPPAPAVGADDVIDILVDEKLASRASLVQGYLYGDDHVVRDVFRPGGEQELYRTKNAQDYTDALKRAKAEVFANAILSLLSGQGGGK